MSKEQRKPYEEKAKIAKQNKDKETCVGESVNVLMQEEKAKEDKENKAKVEIENIVKLANSEGALADTYFYLIHINYFFYHEIQDKYFPAEIALGKFNLRHGISTEDIYHCKIYPGQFPMGYKYTAQQRANETHKLSADFGTQDNIREVLEALTNYAQEKAPFFTLVKDAFVIDKMIQDMCAEYEVDNIFNIYPLDYLLYIMKNMVHGPENKVWPVTTLGTIIFDKDTYEMCEKIACKYHQTVERQVHCSKSKVIRWAYTVCDNCCPVLNIRLIPGQHIPIDADVSNVPLNKLTSNLSNLHLSQNVSSKRSGKTNNIKVSSCSNLTTSAKQSTTAYDSDVGSYHGFQSTDSQAAEEDEEKWEVPKRSVRLRTNYPSANDENLSGVTETQSQPSQSLDMFQSTSRSTYLPGRRPGDTSEVGFHGRGRGRLHRRLE